MIILAAYSGGMDSVASFISCLKKFPDARVIAHHIDISGSQLRGKVESESCHRLSNLIKNNVRQFEYTESFIRTNIIKISLEMKFAIIATMARQYKANIICDGSRSKGLARIPSRSHVDPIYKIIYPDHKLYIPVFGKTKPEVFELLPEWARPHCWSCTYPIEKEDRYEPCGKCWSCDEYIKADLIHPIHYK